LCPRSPPLSCATNCLAVTLSETFLKKSWFHETLWYDAGQLKQPMNPIENTKTQEVLANAKRAFQAARLKRAEKEIEQLFEQMETNQNTINFHKRQIASFEDEMRKIEDRLKAFEEGNWDF
jgi:septal ring factor EnvC (AmiA/AmiB activator)